uniref:Putative zinc-finger domain-containing protein n=1 Tax=Kwoniella dejecticola CBS 10117 TaxID=1296121 RepID=A0A1A6AFE4_9TREE|nr:uncharacterized protein I303_00614 [Kwoniella dejecticola CBS 10117]OBR88797.1 hypothetical protein I303_00614 [Kwoniella dejecticola CBS 10117]
MSASPAPAQTSAHSLNSISSSGLSARVPTSPSSLADIAPAHQSVTSGSNDSEVDPTLRMTVPSTSAQSPYRVPISANAIAGPSSKPILNPPAISSKPIPTMRGTKQKPIVIEEKEEGEISDDDDEIIEIKPVPSRPRQPESPRPLLRQPSSPRSARPAPQLSQRISQPLFRGPPPTAPASHLTKNQRKKQEKKARQAAQRFQAAPQYQQYQSQPRHQPQRPYIPPSSQPGAHSPSIAVMADLDDKGKGKAKEIEREDEAEVSLELNDTVGQPTENLSPEDAEQYIDIIRNLIAEGVSPDTLVERGAPREYVMKVCKEIVDGTKKRKALWLETREQTRADSEAPSIPPPEPDKSPSPDIEVMTDNAERTSIGLERIESDNSSQSDGLPTLERMGATLHNSKTINAHPVKIESYKPGQSSSTRLPTKPIPTAPAALLQTEPRAAATRRPPPPHRRGKKRGADEPSEGDVTLDYDGEQTTLAASSLPRKPSFATPVDTSNHFAILDTIPLTPPFSPPHLPNLADALIPPPEPAVPPPPAPPPLTAEQTLQNTLLDTRRKALESMKRRKAAAASKFVPTSQDPLWVSKSKDGSPELQQSIEEQMASIEREVLEAAAAVATMAPALPTTTNDSSVVAEVEEEQMKVDDKEPEEGEITPSSIPTPLPIPDIILPATALPRPPRGVKRAHAEDLNENNATSLPIRALPSAKRRPFGATQRAQRLVLHLDDSDSDSSDDEEAGTQTPLIIHTPNADVDIIERQRMLEEKEASIRKLKDQIAARMAARKSKTKGETSVINGETPMEKTISTGMAESVIDALRPGAAESGIESPIPADVRQLTKDLVRAEAEVEAMEVDPPHEPAPADHALADNVVEDEDQQNAISASAIQQQESPLALPSLHTEKISLSNSNTDAALLPFVQVDTGATPDNDKMCSPAKVFDKALLNSIVLTRLLRSDPSLVACQAEMSGGKCADRSCRDLHLDKGSRPTGEEATAGGRGKLMICVDEDLLEYLHQILPNEQEEGLLVAYQRAKVETGIQAGMATDNGLSALLTKVQQLLKDQEQ